MILSLSIYIGYWIGSIIYGVMDADADYEKIKTKGAILDHKPEVVSRLFVFTFANILLAPFVPHLIFLLAWNLLSISTWKIVFEARINKHLGQSFLYTGSTSDWDKLFLKLPHGDMVKVMLKAIIFAIGLWLSIVCYLNFDLWMI